tara:strand:- start:55840 stop:56331 length:492 start_codon:yes stop_codon:yes gene_type:complete
LRNELPPNPTSFDIISNGATQFLVNPARESSARNSIDEKGSLSDTPEWFILFDLRNKPAVRVVSIGIAGEDYCSTYSMDGAMARWEAMLSCGWEVFNGEYWYQRSRKYGLGVVLHERVGDYQKIECIDGRVKDIGYGCCIIEYKAAALNPSFHRRKRQIVVKG